MNTDLAGTLYVVGTPIGNLGDFSERGRQTLESVDFIAAEDTRVTVKLLNRFEIKKPMVSYYEHNLREKGQLIVDRILSGESCAIVSDAGMPCISDPGEDLVRLCAQNGIKTVVIPGPSAAISALAVSGLLTSRFTFEGFLSVNKKNRTAHLKELENERRTMIFYEAPHKLLTTLKDMAAVFGDRDITLARELTKLHEEIFRTSLFAAAAHYADKAPRGEFVLIVSGIIADTEAEEDATEVKSFEEVLEIAKDLLEKGEKATEISKRLSKEYAFPKGEIYKALASIKGN